MKSYWKRIKEYFVPRKENNYKPHFFGTAGLLFLSAIIVATFAITILQFRAISSGNYAAIITSVLTDLTNTDRLDQGVGWLQTNETLAFAAQLKANDMAAKGYFSHTSPDGRSPWYWFKQAGYNFSYAGENLAVNFSDSIDVERAWMNSSTHRANIVNGHYTEIGIATAQGTYNGQPTTFVVQLFGRPAVEATPVAQTPTPTGPTEPKVVESGTATPAVAAASKTNVAGEALEIISEDETFVAVKTTDAPELSDVVATPTPASSFLERLFASPTTLLSWVYLALVSIIVIALAVDIAVEIRRQHPLHIVYASALLVLIFVLLYVARAYIFPTTLVL